MSAGIRRGHMHTYDSNIFITFFVVLLGLYYRWVLGGALATYILCKPKSRRPMINQLVTKPDVVPFVRTPDLSSCVTMPRLTQPPCSAYKLAGRDGVSSIVTSAVRFLTRIEWWSSPTYSPQGLIDTYSIAHLLYIVVVRALLFL